MFILVIVLFGIAMRFLPHIPNFSPVTATALFAGVYLGKRYAVIIPLLTLIISDYILLYINPYQSPMANFNTLHPISAMFHSTTLYVWGGFMISSLIGMWVQTRQRVSYLLIAPFLCSLQFFLVTNLGVWATGYYGPGINGLVESYIMGLPFFKWTILGDFFYTIVFFSMYEYGKKIVGSIKKVYSELSRFG